MALLQYVATPGMHVALSLLVYGFKSSKQGSIDDCAVLDTEFDMIADCIDFVHEIESRARIST